MTNNKTVWTPWLKNPGTGECPVPEWATDYAVKILGHEIVQSNSAVHGRPWHWVKKGGITHYRYSTPADLAWLAENQEAWKASYHGYIELAAGVVHYRSCSDEHTYSFDQWLRTRQDLGLATEYTEQGDTMKLAIGDYVNTPGMGWDEFNWTVEQFEKAGAPVGGNCLYVPEPGQTKNLLLWDGISLHHTTDRNQKMKNRDVTVWMHAEWRVHSSGKPSWDDAPEWAEWLCQDYRGDWYFYSHKPTPTPAGLWGTNHPLTGAKLFGYQAAGSGPAHEDWRNTLEPRPQPQVEATEEEEEAWRAKEAFMQERKLTKFEQEHNEASELLQKEMEEQVKKRMSPVSEGVTINNSGEISCASHCGGGGAMFDPPLDNTEESKTNETLWQDADGCDAHYQRHYKGIKLDPYRIAKVYDMKGGPREQIMKKCLRFTDKGQSEREVLEEVKKAVVRWEQMIEEDSQ